MKILVLHNAYQLRGGEDTVVEAEVALLLQAGHEVRLERVSNRDIIGPAGKLNTFLQSAYAADRRTWSANLVQSTGAEIVHVHNFFPLLTPAVHEGAWAAGAAVVQTLHNYRLLCANALFLRNGVVCEKCLHGSNLWGVVHRCYRDSALASLAVTRMQTRARKHGAWRFVDRFIALTNLARSTFIEGGLPPDRIVVKSNFVEAPSGPLGLTRQGGLYVGRLAPEKGVATLVEAWKSLPDQPLTIVGDGPERASLEAAAPSNVRFLGHLTGAAVEYQRAHAALLFAPSICLETFGMVAVEAFATGLPVVASRIGALSELVEDGVTGALVTAGSAEELAATAKQLLKDPAKLAEMGVAARTFYQANFTPQSNLVALEAIYRGALATRATYRGSDFYTA